MCVETCTASSVCCLCKYGLCMSSKAVQSMGQQEVRFMTVYRVSLSSYLGGVNGSITP